MEVIIRNLVASNTYKDEFTLIEKELILFSKSLSVFDLASTRRIKSTVERAMRLAKSFTTCIVETFQQNVLALGSAFEINQHSVQVFSESFVRSHIIFQLSKLAEGVLAYCRKVLKLPPFVIISSRSNLVYGSLKFCYTLGDLLQVESLLKGQKIIVLLESADGTEEIPTCVGGILLMHDLP
jgi:hypothetical protein